MNNKWTPLGNETISLNFKRNLIQQMCIDHYEEILYSLHPRPVVMDNIDRLINCGDPDLVALFIFVLNAVRLNMSPIAVTQSFAAPVALCIPLSVLSLCNL